MEEKNDPPLVLSQLKDQIQNFKKDVYKSCPYSSFKNFSLCNTYGDIYKFYKNLDLDNSTPEKLGEFKQKIDKFKELQINAIPENKSVVDILNALNETYKSYIVFEKKDAKKDIIGRVKIENNEINNIIKYNSDLFNNVFDQRYKAIWEKIHKKINLQQLGATQFIFDDIDITTIITMVVYPSFLALCDVLRYQEKIRCATDTKFEKDMNNIPKDISNNIKNITKLNIKTYYDTNLNSIGIDDKFFTSDNWGKIKGIDKIDDNNVKIIFNLLLSHNSDKNDNYLKKLYWLCYMVKYILNNIKKDLGNDKKYIDLFNSLDVKAQNEAKLYKRTIDKNNRYKYEEFPPQRINQQESSKRRKTKSRHKSKSLRKHKSLSASKRNSKLSKSQKRKTRY
jgi:hypothetical protein